MNTFSRVSLDAFFAALGGFAEPEAHPRDIWKERLRKLWARPMTSDAIAALLGTTGNNVRVHAHLLGLPHRKSGPRVPYGSADQHFDVAFAKGRVKPHRHIE